jgi:hypothetical protein
MLNFSIISSILLLLAVLRPEASSTLYAPRFIQLPMARHAGRAFFGDFLSLLTKSYPPCGRGSPL